MAYSDEEIQASVSTLLRTSIRRPVDSLGVRQIEVTFSDVQEAVAGTFLLNQAAPLYVIALGVARLLEYIQLEAAILTSLIDSVPLTGRRVLPIDSISTLTNAKTALFELEGAVNKRQDSFASIQKTPAFQRFSSNVDQFLGQYGAAVKSGGTIVHTPQGAKADIRALLPRLKVVHAETKRRAAVLQKAMSDYTDVSLPALAASGVLERSRESLARITANLTGKTPTERLELMRDITLQLLSVKSVVKQVGTFQSPSSFFTVEGVAQPYSDSTHLANPAVLRAEKFAPYDVTGAPVLTLTLDGGAPVSKSLSDALYAQADGIVSETYTTVSVNTTGAVGPFTFTAGVDDTFDLLVYDANGTPVGIYVTLTPPAVPLTSVQVATIINTELTLLGVGTLYQAVDAAGAVQLQVTGGTKYAVMDGTANTLLGFTTMGGYTFTTLAAGFLLSANTGPYVITLGVNDVLEVTVLDQTTKQSVQVRATLPAGAAVPAAAIAIAFNTELTNAGVTGYVASSPGGKVSIDLTFPGAKATAAIGGGSSNVTLGFAPGQSVTGTDDNRTFTLDVNGVLTPFTAPAGVLSARHLSRLVNAALNPAFTALATGAAGRESLTVAYKGPATFTAVLKFPSTSSNAATDVLGFLKDVEYTARPSTAKGIAQNISQLFTNVLATTDVVALAGGTGLQARTEPSDPSRVVLLHAYGSGGVTSPAVNTLLLTVSSTTGIVATDVLVLRTGVNEGSKWTVTAVTSTTVTATGTFTPIAGAVEYEVGPNLGVLPGYLVEVGTGAQSGSYLVNAVGTAAPFLPFELEVDGTIPGATNNSRQPQYFTATVGQERLVLTSKNATTASQIVVSGAAASLFFLNPITSQFGTSPWLQLPVKVRGLAAGDVLELYQTSYNTPSSVSTLTEVTNQIVGIGTPVPSNVPITMSVTLVPPFGRLRNASYQRYLTMSAALADWANLAPNGTPYARELERLLNIVLQEPQPTAVQTADAVQQLKALQNILMESGSTTPAATLEAILNAYSAGRVDVVDTLIATYTEKGSARAIDLLLEGQFSTFFGLDVQDVSYSGAMLNQMRQIAQNDLPVSRVGRTMSATSRVQSSAETTDYEFDTTDTDGQKLTKIPNEYGNVPHNSENEFST